MQFKKEIADKNKALLACPTSDKKAYCQEKWLKHIAKLTYPNLDILIVDNSETKDNSEKIKSYKIKNLKVIWVGNKIDFKKENIRMILTSCTNLILHQFKEGNYSHWLSLESDVFPPLNVIEHLMAQHKAVCGLSYFHAGANNMAHTIIHYVSKTGHGIDKKEKETFYDVTGGFIPVYQCGIGCLLVDKIILKKIPYIKYYNTPIKEFADAFFLDALYLKMNYLPKIDTRHYCVHFNNDKNWDEINKIKPI